MAAYGLIGYPLTHSFSPDFFAAKFANEAIDATYTAFPLQAINEFPALLQQQPELKGLNVTIPYKEAILPYLDDIDDIARQVRAVNCIDISNGKTTGYNTDVTGFRDSLQPLLQPQHTHALILGTGGAAKAVAFVLQQLGISFQHVSRSGQKGGLQYDDLTEDIIAQHPLIVNTTPLGMAPNIDTYPPLPYHAIGSQHLLYDLIYSPAETKFLSLGVEQGATVKNGYEMLVLQAEASWRIWSENEV